MGGKKNSGNYTMFLTQRTFGDAVDTGVAPSVRAFIFIAERVQHSHCSSIFIEYCSHSRSRAFRQSFFMQEIVLASTYALGVRLEPTTCFFFFFFFPRFCTSLWLCLYLPCCFFAFCYLLLFFLLRFIFFFSCLSFISSPFFASLVSLVVECVCLFFFVFASVLHPSWCVRAWNLRKIAHSLVCPFLISCFIRIASLPNLNFFLSLPSWMCVFFRFLISIFRRRVVIFILSIFSG